MVPAGWPSILAGAISRRAAVEDYVVFTVAEMDLATVFHPFKIAKTSLEMKNHMLDSR